MDQVQVDVEERGRARPLFNDVRLPDLVDNSAGLCTHENLTKPPRRRDTERATLIFSASRRLGGDNPILPDCVANKRPEKGLLGIRKALGVYANLRPVRAYQALLPEFDNAPRRGEPGQ